MEAAAHVNITEICSRPSASDPDMENLVELQDSFGYDCRKYFNLAMIEETLIFASGNLVHLLDTKSGAMTFKRTVGGQGIGHITTNPRQPHVAVGEKGTLPSVFVFLWPTFDVVSQLENGTEAAFAFLDYSPDGEVLCSQGAGPDFTLALWDWRRSSMLLRCQTASAPVYRAAFSRVQPEIIVTSGRGHIGFWRTAKTFTGLKLTGEGGRFGTTEVCDVVGFECLEDARVASGCDWGNILVWSGACVEYELCTRRDVTCHSAPVFSFHRHGRALVSIGSDGWVRVWDQDGGSRHVDKDRVFRRQEAVVYFSVGDDAQLVSKVEHPADPDVWFLQDGGGAVWRAEVGAALRGEAVSPAVSLLLRSHSGAVAALAPSPHSPHVASLGQTGRLMVHDHVTRQLIARECGLQGSALLWMPTKMDWSGCRLVAGFSTGALSVTVALWSLGVLREVQAWRPHGGPVSALAASPSGRLLASGARDSSVSVLDATPGPRPQLTPRGVLAVPGPVTSLQWGASSQEGDSLLVCCERGHVLEFRLPPAAPPPGHAPLQLDAAPLREVQLGSLAPQLGLRDVTAGPGGEQTGDSSAFDAGPKLLLGRYSGTDSVTLVLGGHPKVTVCEVNLETRSVVTCPLPGGGDAVVECADITSDGSCLVLGLACGVVQLSVAEPDEGHVTWRRFWRLAMHEGALGSQVTGVAMAPDHAHFFSCGRDGNVFVYRLTRTVGEPPFVTRPSAEPDVDEKRQGIPARNLTLTLEEVQKLKEGKRKVTSIRNQKAELMHKLDLLKARYKSLMESAEAAGELLPTGAELHPRLGEHLEAEVAALRSRMLGEVQPRMDSSKAAWDTVHQHFLEPLHADSLQVRAFRDDCFVESYRLKKLDAHAIEHCKEMKRKLEEETTRKSSLDTEGCSTLRTSLSSAGSGFREPTPPPEAPGPSLPTMHALERLRQRQARRRAMLQELDQLIASRPPSRPGAETYEERVREAEQNIGDYKLKCEPEFRVPPELRVTTLRTEHQLIEVKLEIFNLKDEFNKEVFALKARKEKLIARWHHLTEEDEACAADEALRDVIRLQDEELPDKDLLKLCGGRGSDGDVVDTDDAEQYDNVTSSATMSTAVVVFDKAVRAQFERRVSLDVSLVLLELRATSLRHEAHVLREFEPREHALQERLRAARASRAHLQENLSSVNENMRKHKRSIGELTRLERAIDRRFVSEAEGNLFYEPLTTLFKTSYRPPSLSIGSSVTESSFESEVSSDSVSDPPASGSRKRRTGAMSERVCPPGCDPGLFELTNALRVEKYELNLKLTEHNKELELMKKDQEIILKKIKLVNNAIKCILEEIENFHRERQGRLNALLEVVPLRLHQLPADAPLSECVVMSRATLERLEGRAEQLRADTALLEAEFAEDKKSLKSMKLQCEATEKKISELREKIEETMMKRFGKVVDMEEMESVILSSYPDPTSSRQVEKEGAAKISRLKKELTSLKGSLNQSRREKAALTTELAALLREKNDLSEPKSSRHEPCERQDRERRVTSVRRLHEVMTSQREQLSALRHELALLRCKMTSSRDLFPVTQESVGGPGPGEDSEATSGEQSPPRRRSSAVEHTLVTISSTPEILIEHCEDLLEDV